MPKQKTHIILIIALMAHLPLAAIPSYRNQNPPPANPEVVALQNLRGNLETLRHGQKNHENELREFSEKFESLESMIDTLRNQFRDNSKNHKDIINASTSDLETKFSELDLAAKGALEDLRQLKDHANDTSNVLTQYQQRLRDMEKASQRQAQQIENLQNALKAVTEILGKEEDETSQKIYMVKSGDTLEKIAVANQTSIKVLKELNNLPNDRIKINQKLKLPDK